MQRCFACQQEFNLPEPPGPGSVCAQCGQPWRCCFNCRQYSPAALQQCLVRGLPYIRDKKAATDCPAFALRDYQPQRRESDHDRAQKKIDDLFKNL